MAELLGEKVAVKKYSYRKDLKLLDVGDQQLLVKPKKRYDLEAVYRYLEDHHVTNYLPPLQMTDKEVLFPYLPASLLTKDELAKKLVYNLSVWQSKTTVHQRLDVDEIKTIYEEKHKMIEYLVSYYRDLSDLVDTKVYMAPSEYYFARNNSILFAALQYASSLLETWYEKIKVQKNYRKTYCHGKCQLDHFLANDNGYFISLEQAHLGDVTEDFVHFYKQNYKDVDMSSTFQLYQHKYPFTEEEKLFFYLSLVLPTTVELYPSSLTKTKELVNFFEEMKMTSEFLLEQEKQNQEHQH